MTDQQPDEQEEQIYDNESMLDQIIRAHAEEHFNKALHSQEGLFGYYQLMLEGVVDDYRNPRAMKKNVNDFLVDRFIFYRRHREMDKDMATKEAYCDTFEYLVSLKNDFPPMLPVMKDNWRH